MQDSALIKSRIRISEFISNKVSLKPKGAGKYVGLCPFHQEKTPSFFVDDEKGNYHCFGCGVHGDIFSFLMEYEGCNYKDALERLAEIAGVQIIKPSPLAKIKADKTKQMKEIYQLTSEFYQKQLEQSQEARNYISKRGLKPDIVKEFALGYSPRDSKHLMNYLQQHFSVDEILEN